MKILLFDIENAPSIGYLWGLYQEISSTKFIKDDWYVLCWAAKWLDSDKVMTSALPDYPLYKKDMTNDKEVLKSLWGLLDTCDIAIAHNGRSFDRRKANARFIRSGMNPPSPYKMIDTLLEARNNFFFTSNRLDDLGVYLKAGRKTPTGGFDLWKDCLAGKKEAWKHMVDYCKQDVVLLEKVYKKMRPWMNRHPNTTLDDLGGVPKCQKCGSEKLEKRGVAYTPQSKFQRFICKSCKGWGRYKISQGTSKVSNISG